MKKGFFKIGFNALLLVLMISACSEPEVGPQGPQGEKGEKGDQGEQGPVGPIGQDGNANVTVYTYEGHNFTTIAQASFTVPVTEEEYNESIWLVYLEFNNITYSVPGWGMGGSSEYRVWSFLSIGSPTVRVRLQTGNGETYNEIRVVGIKASTFIDGRIQLPDIDLTNYDEVMAYYGLVE